MARVKDNYLNLMICGSRGYVSYLQVRNDVLKIIRDHPDKQVRIITGRASSGADDVAYHLARWDLELPYLEFKADWDKYGKGAGFIRNVDMVNISDMMLAYWDSESKGTKHAIGLGKRKRIPMGVTIINREESDSRTRLFS